MTLAQSVEQLAVQTVDGENSGPALLQWLRDAMAGGDTGRTRSGGGSKARPNLNVEAFTLFEDISGQIAAAFNSATDRRPNRSPEVNLLAWHAVFAAAAERGDLSELQLTVATGRVAGWAKRIREHFDPPMSGDLTIACPVCGQYRVLRGEDVDTTESQALTVTVRDGELVVACQNPDCRATWRGDVEVIQLGREAGVELNVDAIREARVPVMPNSDESGATS